MKERGFSDKRVRNQVLKARKFRRDDLLDQVKEKTSSPKLTLNLTYHPALARFRENLEKIHLLLTPDQEHRRVFKDIPVIGFKRGKSLKDHLVRAKLPKLEPKASEGCVKCGKKRCGVCKHLKQTDKFTSRDGTTYSIRAPSSLNCDSDHVVYLAQCKKCNIQYVGSTVTPFRYRFNNYRNAHNRFIANKTTFQATFHSHFAQKDHKGLEDLEFILIDHGINKGSVRKRESFWQFKLNTFTPQGLNERKVETEFD